MRSPLRGLVAFCALLALLSSPASAQLVDAVMNPGDQFEGEISSPDDVDVVHFDSIAGAGLVIAVGPGKKSTIVPSVQLVDLSDDSVVVEATAAKKKLTIKFDNADKGDGLPTTGTYALRISGAEGSTGTYKLRFTEKVAKATKKLDVEEDVDNGEELCVEFEAAEGFEATLLVQKGKKSTADPGEPALTGPDGGVDFPDGSVKVNKKGDKYTIKKVPLDESGEYKFAAPNEGDDGALKARVQLKRIKQKRRKLTELPIGETEVNSLSGFIAASNDGMGLEGVTVEVVEVLDGDEEGALVTLGDTLAETVTDANGNFIVQDLPLGPVEVFLDGSGAVNGPKGAVFGTLIVFVEVTGPNTQLPQALVMADLADPSAANQSVMTSGGQTTEPIAAVSGTGEDIELAGGTGTTILLGGVPAEGMVDLNVTPVPPQNVPMPLMDGSGNPLDAGSYVTIQPPNAEFDSNTAPFPDPGAIPEGLDVVFPNDRGFPPGTLMDVWSFDHDAGEWVNRSAQTGNQGVVSGDGSRIEADGVILKGGWHAPVLPIDPACATTVTGTLVDADTGDPVPGATVATSFGQFALTDADGDFSVVSVPAYGLPNPPCTAVDLNVEFVTTVDYGGVRTDVDVMAGSVVTGGETDLGTVMIDIPDKGSLTGLVSDNGVPVAGATVSVGGDDDFDVVTDDEGRFFLTCVEPGSYTASVTFAGDDDATVVGFGVTANQLTALNLQRSGGGGKKSVTVCVLRDMESFLTPWEPVAGAKVTLVGSDAASQVGLFATTNGDGKAVFTNVDPPYTITAQMDVVLVDDGEPGIERLATTVVGMNPKTNRVTIPIASDEDEDFPQTDAMISGTILDLDPSSVDPGVGDGQSVAFFTMDAFDAETGIFLGGTFVNGSGDTPYNLGVLSGRPIHLVLRREEEFFADGPGKGDPGFGGLTIQTTGALWELSIPALMPGEDRDVDLDWDDALIFDREVPLTLENVPEPPDDPGFFFLHVSGSFDIYDFSRGVDELSIGRYSSQGPPGFLPDVMWLPDLDDPKLDDFRTVVLWEWSEFAEVFNDGEALGAPPFLDRGVVRDLPVTKNPSNVIVDFPDPVTIDSPANGSFFDTVPAFLAAGLMFDDQVPKSSAGYSDFILECFELYDDELGVDSVSWDVLNVGGATTFEFPPTALPMLADGLWEMCLESQTYEGVKADLNTVLAGDTEDILRTLWVTHKGFAENFLLIEFDIGDEPKGKGGGDF